MVVPAQPPAPRVPCPCPPHCGGGPPGVTGVVIPVVMAAPTTADKGSGARLRAGSARGMACRPSRSTALGRNGRTCLRQVDVVMATALPILGVQYLSAIRRSPLPRVRRVACIPKGRLAPTGLVQLWTLTCAVPGGAWHAGVTCTLRVPGGFRPFLPRARANRSRVAARAGTLSPRRMNP